MSINTIPELKAMGLTLDTSSEAFGPFRASDDALNNFVELRRRYEEDGYLYIPGFFDRAAILEARMEILRRLQKDGLLHPDKPWEEGWCHPDKISGWGPQYADNNPSFNHIAFGDQLLNFYKGLIDSEVRHYDYKWFRPVSTNQNGAPPHCDIVYMGRGTRQVFTAWIPYGDIPLEMGGLMMLEGSYAKREKLNNYLKRDVDTYCTNYSDAEEISSGRKTWQWDGWLTNNPVSLRQKMNGRWLCNDIRAGDLLTFGMCTIHAFLDNQTPYMRLTSDTRYQSANEPIDHRWIGENPIAHGLAGKRGKIC